MLSDLNMEDTGLKKSIDHILQASWKDNNVLEGF